MGLGFGVAGPLVQRRQLVEHRDAVGLVQRRGLAAGRGNAVVHPVALLQDQEVP